MGFECGFCGEKFESKKGLKIHKSKAHPKSVKTKIDEMLELVRGEGKITLGELSEKLELEKAKIEKWAKTLDRYELAELVYPENPLKSPYLQVEDGKEEKRA